MTQPILAEEAPNLYSQIEGDWITYRGDQFEVRHISKGKVNRSIYNWDGTLRFEVTSDIELKSSGTGESQYVVEKGAKWQYLDGGKVPVDGLWSGLSFDAEKEGWKTGKAGFGYSDGDDETVIEDMQDNYQSVFIRREFEIPGGADLKGLGLLINYDDGFILHANGRRLFSSSNVTVDEQTRETVVSNHEANGAEFFSLSEYASAFREGKNVLAIEGINTNLESTDFTLDPQVLIGGTGSFVDSNRKEEHVSPQTEWFYKDRCWNGKVDNLQIWGRALNDDEVVALWNEGKGVAQASGEMAADLIGHWLFDGDFKDASGNGRHGTGNNSPGFGEGQFGQALELNGDDQFVQLGGKPADYTPEGGSITLSFWFTADKFDKSWQTLVSLGDGGWRDWRVHRFNMSDNIGYVGGRWVRNNAPVLDGKMHHLVAITEAGKGVRIFIDNILVSNNVSSNRAAAFTGIPQDEDGWLPAVGANLQGRINLSTPLEGEFIPMLDSLRVVVTNRNEGQGGNQVPYAGLFRKLDHPEEALLNAARMGNIETVAALLEDGVDPNATSRNSYTALGLAGAGGHLELMKLLIKSGADVNKQAAFMKSPLGVVAGSPHIAAAKLLIANGAQIKPNWNGSVVTHDAVYWGQPKMLEFILTDLGVDPNLKARNGSTALHWAITRMNRGENDANEPYLESVKVLLKHGANPNLRFTQNGNNRSAVELATSRELDEIVLLLSKR